MLKEATAIYSDNENGNVLKDHLKHGILVTDGQLQDVQDHILFFSNDLDNLSFYRKNKEALQGKNVYMKLDDIDSFLLCESTIHFFNLNEMTARKYWQEYHLLSYFQEKGRVVKIAIIGFSSLGRQILNYGLLNNIYDIDQEIEYHIWGDSCLYEHLQEHVDLMNKDRIIYEGNHWVDDLQKLVRMDRIIITEEDQMDLLQTLLYLCDDTEIHYYNSKDIELEEIFRSEKLRSFGSMGLLTEENIKRDVLGRAAKELNYKYASLYGNISSDIAKKEEEMEEQWELLDGFTKGSNIASVDYHKIRKLILEKARKENREVSVDHLGRMEHIRWCRYLYLNHWIYGKPENGKAKDAKRRIHVCLVPYEELTKEDQEKDYESVKILLELMPIRG